MTRSSIPDMTASPNGFKASFSLMDRNNPLILVIGILYVGIALLSDRFLEVANQMNILRQVSVYLVIALGMTLVIASKGIDLSVGSSLGFCAMTLGTIFGTVLGILTIGILENGMVLIGADFHMQRLLLGFLLIFSVAFQEYRRRAMDTKAFAPPKDEDKGEAKAGS